MKKINKKIFAKIFSWISWVILALFLLCSAINFIDSKTGYNMSIFGYRYSVIASDSMSYVNKVNAERLEGYKNQLQKGDIIFIEEYKSYEDIKVNDVVTYLNGTILVCHRVVEKVENEGKQSIITQGDANTNIDGFIDFSLVKGKVVSVIPKIGYISLYLQSTYGIIGICSVLFIVFVSLFILEILKNKEKKVVLEIKEEDKKDEVKKDN